MFKTIIVTIKLSLASEWFQYDSEIICTQVNVFEKIVYFTLSSYGGNFENHIMHSSFIHLYNIDMRFFSNCISDNPISHLTVFISINKIGVYDWILYECACPEWSILWKYTHKYRRTLCIHIYNTQKTRKYMKF